MMVNVVAKGFIVGPKTYLKDSANWLDAVIVFFGLFDFAPGGVLPNMSAARSLRILRAVNKYPKLRDLVVLLAQCVGKLMTVVLICCFIFLVFGILGINLYAGMLLFHNSSFVPDVTHIIQEWDNLCNVCVLRSSCGEPTC